MRLVGVIALAAVAALTALPSASYAEPASLPQEQERTSPYMRVFAETQPPYGFVQFCARLPEECQQGPVAERFSATPQRLSELDTINRRVNREIAPATDMEIYGQAEYWTLPTTRGDCEDYALLKRKRLMARGWPASALLMTVVRDEKGEGHAVLTARTLQGDFILDNKIDEVKVWHRTRYEFIMRQSHVNPHVWRSLDPSEGHNSTAPLVGVRSVR